MTRPLQYLEIKAYDHTFATGRTLAYKYRYLRVIIPLAFWCSAPLAAQLFALPLCTLACPGCISGLRKAGGSFNLSVDNGAVNLAHPVTYRPPTKCRPLK